MIDPMIDPVPDPEVEIPQAQIRAALRDGLREEAAPISRRLAEVKGLSNNAIRRLENLEATIESERGARVDDLALLVELLTEGWRTMNARLDRIEAALQPSQANTAALAYQFADKLKKNPDLRVFNFTMADPRLLPNGHAQFRIEGRPR